MKVIGIIGAMEEEVAMLKEKMTEVTVHHKAGMEFFRGKLNEKEAVVVEAVKASGLAVLEVTHQGEWVSVTAQKKQEN